MAKKNKRYFLLFYIASAPKEGLTATATGCHVFWTKKGYLNKDEVVKLLKKENPGMFNIVTTNIIELNESDYNDWIKTEDK